MTKQVRTRGADSILIAQHGVDSQLANREIVTLGGTAQTASWIVADQPVYAIEISASSETAEVAGVIAALVFTLDAPNDTIRDNWLTKGSHLTNDSENDRVFAGQTRRIEFTHPLTSIGMKQLIGTNPLHVIIRAEVPTKVIV